MKGKNILQALTLLQKYVGPKQDIGFFVNADEVYIGTDIEPDSMSLADRMLMERLTFVWDDSARAWRYSC